MIKKLDIMKDTRNVIDKGGIVHTVANFTAIEKINELVDAVNELQATISKMEKVEPADPYAEQRKWIGKLCRFWNIVRGDMNIGILKSIDETKNMAPYINDIGCACVYCEPVKPDDDIIYRGE